MPIYEYKCAECGDVFETLVRGFSQEVSSRCPKCGSRETDRLFSVFASHGVESRSSSGASCSTCTSTNCATCRR